MSQGWETGERHRYPWLRAVLVAVVAAAVLVFVTRDRGGLEVSPGSIEPGGSEPGVGPAPQAAAVAMPPREAGDRFYCPSGFAFAAYPDGYAYPPQHPSSPDISERPSFCYADLDRAQANGYELAPQPPAAEVVADLYLLTPPDELRAACVERASELGFAVPCPTLLPHPADGFTVCPRTTAACASGFLLESRDYPLPPGWCDDCSGHLAIGAAQGGQPAELVTCGRENASRTDAGLERCPAGPPWVPGSGGYPHESQTMTVWSAGGVEYALSVEGHGRRQAELVERLAAAIELVEPAPA